MNTGFEGRFKITDINSAPVDYGNVYEMENIHGRERVILAPSNGCIPLMHELVKVFPGSVFLLLILAATRAKRDPGRYQSRLFSLGEVETFLREFGEFLDRDGRQRLWIGDPDRSGLLVWDSHQVVYAYGDVARYESIAQSMGLTSGKVEIPYPHKHCYHPEFDSDEGEILERYEWHWTPLQDGDE